MAAAQCCALWERVKSGERWGREWALRALAAARRLQLSLAAYADELYGLTQVRQNPKQLPGILHQISSAVI